jgi:hypothetical protein
MPSLNVLIKVNNYDNGEYKETNKGSFYSLYRHIKMEKKVYRRSPSAMVLKLFTSEPPWQKKILSAPTPPVSFYQNRSHCMFDVLFSLFCVFLHTIWQFLLKIKVLLGLQ